MRVTYSKKRLTCKRELPSKFAFSSWQLRDGLGAEKGRVLSYWTDFGLGSLGHEWKAAAIFSKYLVDASADMIRNCWRPWTPKKNWCLVTCVPSNADCHRKLVSDFAKRLANCLQLPFRLVVVEVGNNELQKERKNNTIAARTSTAYSRSRNRRSCSKVPCCWSTTSWGPVGRWPT